MPDRINTLLIGGGGREHALALKLTQSPRLGDLWTSHPENPGLASLARPVDVPVTIREVYRLVQFCDKKNIGLVVIGPEEPLAEGFADKLAAPGRLVFGPSKEAAQLEADKAWAKDIMRAGSIPTPEALAFIDPEDAKAYIRSRRHVPVVKAAGLARGKGVFVPETLDAAVAAVDRIMLDRAFGDAGRRVVIEERLAGPEVSVLAIVDGRNILVLPPCQDHKRLLDGDAGPNTGGMGAFCPSDTITEEVMAKVEREILVPTIDTLRRDGIEYRGVLYAGLMVTHSGPKVLEFNARFGDPECQPLMARLKSDLLELMLATCEGRLDQVDVEWDDRAACCVVLASRGYPDAPKPGAVITGLDAAAAIPGVLVHHAGTKQNSSGELVAAGGRVLSVTALGDGLEDARRLAYEAADKVHFEGMQFRRDIGAPRRSVSTAGSPAVPPGHAHAAR